ncbi:YicC family protein [Halobacillus salinarum]|uniref:YicC family protein n=1 Tax=Halobacillus salinarum TaxID=2932257 RepID=A0ABY4EGC0_9BACI|nr:YicC/YloC family endoribonuclease [Halobacillus salinarum]UOQ43108.1 YicC family protein [Halobacillus salinarum]
MVKSMTGYGRKSLEVEGMQLHVEIRSVNHRFLDISTKLPRNLLFLEEKLKRLIRYHLSRGRVDLYVTLEGQGLVKRTLHVDWNIADQYIERLVDMKKRYELTGEITVDMVTRLEHVFSVQEKEEDSSILHSNLLQAVQESLDRLSTMRSEEGRSLEADLTSRCQKISAVLQKLEDRRPSVVEEYKERIRQRIEAYTKEEVLAEQSRVLQEVALLAEKGDVTEELTRLKSHLDQFSKTLQKQESIGRRLDFIVQEMHREVNTIGSKSNDNLVTEWVVELKSEIEKLKEQVQNVE